MVWWKVSHQGVKLVSKCIEDVLQGVVKHLNMAFSGQEWVLQQDSVPAQKAKITQEWLQRNLLAFISTENWLSGSADLKPWTKTVGCFGGHGVPKASQQPREPKESPCEGRDPPGDGSCDDSIVAGASQGLRQAIGRPF
jgi:hypothetical protein